MKPYTVLLLRPDYQADEFGKDTYMAHVREETPRLAQEAAQIEALTVNYPHASIKDLHSEGTFASDYAVLAVIGGHHNDIKDTA